MRKTDSSIPSEFVEFDTTVTDPDAFINVRDMQTYSKNHNILLSRRCRNQSTTQCFNWAASPPALQSIEPVTMNRSRGELAFAGYIYLNYYVKQVKIIIWASRSTVAGNPDITLYPAIDSYGGKRPLNDEYKITVNSATPAAYTTTIDLLRNGGYAGSRLYIYYSTPMATADEDGFSALPITDVHNVKGGVIANFPSSPKNKVMYFSDTKIPPKMVRDYTGGGAATKCAYIERTFEGKTPVPGSTTVSVRDTTTLSLYAISIYPLETNAFEEPGGGY